LYAAGLSRYHASCARRGYALLALTPLFSQHFGYAVNFADVKALVAATRSKVPIVVRAARKPTIELAGVHQTLALGVACICAVSDVGGGATVGVLRPHKFGCCRTGGGIDGKLETPRIASSPFRITALLSRPARTS
jgi:hypothetical protein